MEHINGPLKIVHIITGSEAIGGAETHVRDLIDCLRLQGHLCTVLAGPPEGLFWSQMRRRSVPVRLVPSLHKRLHPVRDCAALLQIVAALRNLAPDLVAVHTAKASFLGRLAAALLRIPSVYTPHGLSIVDRRTGNIHPLFLNLERLAGNFVSRVITVSAQERQLAEKSGIVDSRKLATIHNGIPDLPLVADPRREPPTITMIARFEPPKDHETLLCALATLKEYPWSLRLAGSGSLRQAAQSLAARLGISNRIEFLGECADTAGLLSQSQIFVLTSKSEAFPVSILEAMRAGLPVIASNVGGVSEAVRDGETGFLVPAKDHRALIAKLLVLLCDPALRADLGCSGRQRYLLQFTADVMAAKTMALYAEVLASRRTSPNVVPLSPAGNPNS